MSQAGIDEFNKLITLSRGARGRINADEGAAVRDDMGRTYAGAAIQATGFALTAIQFTVASAISAGATGLEAVVLCADSADVSDEDVMAVRGLAGVNVPITVISMRGDVINEVRT